ncbi:hypothetical protein BURKHO8Y_30247 [Burkholderia sp. 8Y]|nr:hypothetical protein BURKHO8Y_30247 [Burkholderia sp. 8Y]
MSSSSTCPREGLRHGRIGTAPSRTHRGAQARTPQRAPGTKKQRELTQQDLEATMMALHERKRGAQPSKNRSAVSKR